MEEILENEGVGMVTVCVDINKDIIKDLVLSILSHDGTAEGNKKNHTLCKPHLIRIYPSCFFR